MAKKLLLADDSITIQKVVELVLSEEDFQIKAVNNGDEAVNQIDVFKPDIVLADIEMPGVNGYQLCERIKKNTETAHIAVILLAGAFEPLDEDLARNVRADDFIIKPFESQELIGKINGVLSSAGGVPVSEPVVMDEGPEIGVIEEPAVADVAEATEVFEATEDTASALKGGGDDLWAIDEAEVSVESTGEEGQSIEEAGEALAAEFSEGMTVDASDISVVSSTQAEMAMESAPAVEPVAMPSAAPSREPAKAKPESVPMPSADEISRVVTSAVEQQVRSVIEGMDLRSVVSEAARPIILASIESSIQEIIPGIIKESISDIIQGQVEKQIENVIWETVPDLAENLIKKEIEKIKSEF